MIEIENVSFRHGETPILNNLSLTLPKGGVTALIGPNGAGKSTLFALMARLLPLQSGCIRFDGLDVGSTPSPVLARKLAILRQDSSVATRLSVSDLIGFGRYPHHLGRPAEKDLAMVEAALEEFGLVDMADRFVDQLSGGQRQRALVAMAFAQDTDYLLLDEPLNNLDMYFARDLMRHLGKMAGEHGKTVVIVLHEINYAAAHADRIVALKNGSLVASGPATDIMTTDCLKEVFGMDVKIETLQGQRIALHHA